MYYIKATTRAYMVSDHFGRPLYWHVQDSAMLKKESQALLKQYLIDGCERFKKEMDILTDTDRSFSEIDVRKLNSMLELLTYARTVWQEENVPVKTSRGVI